MQQDHVKKKLVVTGRIYKQRTAAFSNRFFTF
jgi:hypothetical protein